MDKIELYCDLIKSNCECKNCGCEKSFTSDGNCKACNKENRILKKILSKLKKELETKEKINIYDELCLYSVSDLNFDFVEKVIEDNDINEDVKIFYIEILENIAKKNDLTELQTKFLIENSGNKRKLEINGESSNIIDYLTYNFFSGDYKDIPMISKLKLVNSLSNNIVHNMINDDNYYSKITIYNDENDKNAVACFSKNLSNSKDCFIVFDKTKVKDLIEKEDYIFLLEAIYHETQHALNYYLYKNLKQVNTKNMILAKETALHFTKDDYYNDNYYVYHDEVLARYYSYINTRNHLKSLGLNIVDDDKYLEKIKEEETLLNNFARKIDGETMNVNEAFDKYVKETSWLSTYPILNIEYKKLDGTLVRKKSDEVKNDYEKFKHGELSYNGSNEDIDVLYQEVLKRASMNEMFKSDSGVKMNDSSIKNL